MREALIWGQSRRLRLRQATDADLEALRPWLGSVAVIPLESLLAAPQPPLAVTLIGQEVPIGAIAWTADEDGWFTTRLIAIDPARRGHGLGGEAILALEQGARHRRLAWRFRGIAPADNGLALYFWLRLGYRPTTIRPLCDGRPGLWMAREAPLRFAQGQA